VRVESEKSAHLHQLVARKAVPTKLSPLFQVGSRVLKREECLASSTHMHSSPSSHSFLALGKRNSCLLLEERMRSDYALAKVIEAVEVAIVWRGRMPPSPWCDKLTINSSLAIA